MQKFDAKLQISIISRLEKDFIRELEPKLLSDASIYETYVEAKIPSIPRLLDKQHQSKMLAQKSCIKIFKHLDVLSPLVKKINNHI